MNHAHTTGSVVRRRRMWRYLATVFTACALLVGTAIPAAAAELMRVTFIRHGQSLGNASGSIDSSTPGPVLSQTGYQQAEAVAARLGNKNYDAVYASSMVRTLLTAAPMSRHLGLPVEVLPGLQEIEAGVYEGTPESEAASGYMLAPLAWAFQGDLDARIPGSIDGHEFDARMDGALQTMYDNGSRNAVVFSHGAAMMFWTFMNVENLTAAQKMELLRASLRNTADVVIEGNPEDGWKLISWDGKQFSPKRSFHAEVKLHRNTLKQQLGTVRQSVREAFATRDFPTILSALNDARTAVKFAVSKYHRAVRAEFIDRITKPAAPVTPAPAHASTLAVSAEATSSVAEPSAERDETPQASAAVARKRGSLSQRTVEVAESAEVAGVADRAESGASARSIRAEARRAVAESVRTEGEQESADREPADAQPADAGPADAEPADSGAESASGSGSDAGSRASQRQR